MLLSGPLLPTLPHFPVTLPPRASGSRDWAVGIHSRLWLLFGPLGPTGEGRGGPMRVWGIPWRIWGRYRGSAVLWQGKEVALEVDPPSLEDKLLAGALKGGLHLRLKAHA